MANLVEKINTGTVVDKSWFDITLIKICVVLLNCLWTIVIILYYVITWIFLTLIAILAFLLSLFIYWFTILFIPMVIIVIVYFIFSVFWDDGAKPILEIAQMAINFVVELWNSIVRALRSFGVNLDTADGFGQGIPTFWEFIKNIIYIMVWKPIELGLKGAIIR